MAQSFSQTCGWVTWQNLLLQRAEAGKVFFIYGSTWLCVRALLNVLSTHATSILASALPSLCGSRQAGRRAWGGGVWGSRNAAEGVIAAELLAQPPLCQNTRAELPRMTQWPWLWPSVCPSAVSFSCHPVMSWWHGWQGSWKGALSTLEHLRYNRTVGDKSWQYLLTSWWHHSSNFPLKQKGIDVTWCCKGLACNHDYLCGF